MHSEGATDGALKGLTQVVCVCPEGKRIDGVRPVATGNICICDCKEEMEDRLNHWGYNSSVTRAHTHTGLDLTPAFKLIKSPSQR